MPDDREEEAVDLHEERDDAGNLHLVWTCCGVPVRTVGLSVQCQGACGRTSR